MLDERRHHFGEFLEQHSWSDSPLLLLSGGFNLPLWQVTILGEGGSPYRYLMCSTLEWRIYEVISHEIDHAVIGFHC